MSVPASIMRSVHQPPTPRPRYPSDLSDTAWSRIRDLVVPTHHKGGRPCSQARWREYVDALLYITRTGIPWRALPHDFTAGWSAAHEHLTKWTRTGPVSYTHLRAHETRHDLVCRLLLEKKKKTKN